MPALETRPLSYALGVEVMGLDLRKQLDPATVDALEKLWDQHLVLLIRGQQDITPEQQVAFTRYFGPAEEYAPNRRMEGYPEVLRITNKLIRGKPSNTREAGRNWHSDETWSETPASGALLRCVEKPDVGGDTMFANLNLGYETLPPKLKAFIEDMEAVHDYRLVSGLEKLDQEYVADLLRRFPPVVHKCVQSHPKTGKKFLFLGDRVRNFVGMSEQESRPFLQFFVQHATRPEFTYRHQWQVGDIVMWQNRYTMHLAMSDFDQSKARDMHRTTIRGESIGYRQMAEAA